MNKEELLELNISLLLLGFKVDALVKSLTEEQKEVYKNLISERKKLFSSTMAKSLPEDKVSEFLLMLDVD